MSAVRTPKPKRRRSRFRLSQARNSNEALTAGRLSESVPFNTLLPTNEISRHPNRYRIQAQAPSPSMQLFSTEGEIANVETRLPGVNAELNVIQLDEEAPLTDNESDIDLLLALHNGNGFQDEPSNSPTDKTMTDEYTTVQDQLSSVDAIPENGIRRASPSLSDDADDPAPIVTLMIGNWRVLWGLLLTNGSMKLTKTQYQAMRIISDTFRRMPSENWGVNGSIDSIFNLPRQRIEALPHYSTLYKRIKPLLYSNLAVRGSEHMEEICVRKAGARAKSYSDDGASLVPVHTILPSEYARADVGCDPVFRLMRSSSFSEASDAHNCIDSWPLISARPWFYGPRRHFSVDSSVRGHFSDFAESGDTISIQFLGSGDLHPEISVQFAQLEGQARSMTLLGQVVHVWTSPHESRKGQAAFVEDLPSHLSERDKSVIKPLLFCSYLSPSDTVSVEIPPYPVDETGNGTDQEMETVLLNSRRQNRRTSPHMREAMRLRKRALQELRQQREDAWLGWRKPLLKPGDLVALLRPSLSLTSYASRIVLVHRFWAEEDERSRHIFWLRGEDSVLVSNESLPYFRGFTSLTTGTAQIYRDVRSVHLVSSSSQVRGVDKFRPVSSLGASSSGERYFIYRFLLFWDGFEITAGKSASGEGFYMVCLNLPVQARASAAAVRIIGLTPPGVKIDAIFQRIRNDITTGMSEGFLDIAADGKPIRIFLDLVGFIGDTAAINAALDVLGHTATACCHLCRFSRRSSTLVGSRYTHHGFHASSSSTVRGFYQHTGIHDSGAKEETCRLLGISYNHTDHQLPLHALRADIIAAQESVPTTGDGTPVLHCVLDPYRACLVAPDHLLTGHFRDCINAAFRLLPTTAHRKSAEKYMIAFLHECGLPAQNRLFDFEKKSLYSMSMSELYTLSVVSHSGFVRACVSLPVLSSKISSRCRESIAVVISCSSLIAQLWNPSKEGKTAACSETYLTDVQERTRTHMGLIRSLCEMDDAAMQELENSRTSTAIKASISKEYSERIIAINAIDKPNVHRLFELVFSTLHSAGFVSRVGELVMEKAHQRLKRAIRQSNNKDIQLQFVLSAVFADWQGRLTIQIDGALKNDTPSVFWLFPPSGGARGDFQSVGYTQQPT